MSIQDDNPVDVNENVVLAKYDGDSTDHVDMIERIVVENGVVTEHNTYDAGTDMGPVKDSELLGQDIGRFFPNATNKEVR